MKSIWYNNLWYRILVAVVWFLFLLWLNFLVFAPFMWKHYGYTEVFLVLFLWLFLYYLIKVFKYEYKIREGFLYIKWPFKYYKIPLLDIEKIWEIHNIPLKYKVWYKFDLVSQILYLCGYVDKWIILKLKTHDIVICPIKYKQFYENLKENIK